MRGWGAVLCVVWCVVACAVIGVRTQGEDGAVVPGTPASAPTRPRLLRVALLTTLVSALVFAGLWAAVRYNAVNLELWLGRGGPR